MTYYFYVPTMTQAMRGKDALGTAGITGFVSRNTDLHAGEGCSYSIAVSGDGVRAERVLQQHGVKITRKARKETL